MKNINPLLRSLFRNTGDAAGAAGAGAAGGEGAGKGEGSGAGGAGAEKPAEGEKPKGGDGAEGDKPPAAGKGGAPAGAKAPESYTLTVPEADAAWANDLDVARIKDTGKASQWSQDDVNAELTALIEERKAGHAALLAETQAHPEIGGDKLAVAQKHALRALDQLLPADSADGKRFRADVNRLGLASYAPLVLLLSRAGQLMAEDNPGGTGGNGGGTEQVLTVEDALWPTKKK